MPRPLTFCPLFGWKGAGANAMLVLVAWRRTGGGGVVVLGGGEEEAAVVFGSALCSWDNWDRWTKASCGVY